MRCIHTPVFYSCEWLDRSGRGEGLMSLVVSGIQKDTVKDRATAYIDQLYRVAFNLTKSRADAEDLVQETYLRAFDKYEQFELGTNLKAWLTKILYNLFVNRYHRDRKTVSIDQPVDDEKTPPIDSMKSSAPGPELQFLQTELREKLKEALSELSEDFATPIILVDIGECSYAEVAEIISCPIGTVRSRLFRGRSILADKLRDYVRN